jgi:hypothetical protein
MKIISLYICNRLYVVNGGTSGGRRVRDLPRRHSQLSIASRTVSISDLIGLIKGPLRH